MNTLYSTTSTDPITALRTEITMLRDTITRLRRNESLDMLNSAGLSEAVRTLKRDTTYTVVFADIDRLRALNSATGNHVQADRYLRAGLAVRYGEIAGQMAGDQIVFLLDDQARDKETDPDAFVARITRQLAGQPLLQSERYLLAAVQGCHVDQARLSATFAAQSGVSAGDVWSAVERLSCEVLAMKKARDAR